MTAYAERIREAEAYQRLCAEAESLGVPVALDDPRTPHTVEALRGAVVAARRQTRIAYAITHAYELLP